MIVGKKEITEYFIDCGKPYFAIFNKGQVGSGNAIRRNDKDEADYDFAGGLAIFEKILSLLGYGEYVLMVNGEKDATKKGRFDIAFKIPINEVAESNNNTQMIAGMGGGGITKEEAEKIGKEMYEKYKMQDENTSLKEKLKEAEREVKELTGKVSKPMNDIVGALAPHVGDIISSVLGRTPTGIAAPLPISGATPSSIGEGEEATDEVRQKIFQDFITAISTARPNNWLEIIQKLTLLAGDETKLEMALKFI